MIVESLHMDSLVHEISNCDIVKKKRERAVFKGNGLFYKVWVPNWTQGKITKHCFDVGFYDHTNASSVINLIHDDTGPRGYVQRSGQTVVPHRGAQKHEWELFKTLTDKKTRFDFVLDLMKKSIATDGTFSDFAPSNVIMHNNKPNLIDLESYRSFDLIFDRKRAPFETFDLDAWWKPHETALRDVNAYFKSYCKACLGVAFEFDIVDRDSFINMSKAIEDAASSNEV